MIGRDRFAYRRLVWRCAQLLTANETVWGAISDLVTALEGRHLEVEPDEDEVAFPSTVTSTLSGAEARRIMHEHSIKPGVLVATLQDRLRGAEGSPPAE